MRAILRAVDSRLHIDTLTVEPGVDRLALNDIGTVQLRLAEPIVLDDYAEHRRTGAFLLVDPADGTTLAAGMVGPSIVVGLAGAEERCRAL